MCIEPQCEELTFSGNFAELLLNSACEIIDILANQSIYPFCIPGESSSRTKARQCHMTRCISNRNFIIFLLFVKISWLFNLFWSFHNTIFSKNSLKISLITIIFHFCLRYYHSHHFYLLLIYLLNTFVITFSPCTNWLLVWHTFFHFLARLRSKISFNFHFYRPYWCNRWQLFIKINQILTLKQYLSRSTLNRV